MKKQLRNIANNLTVPKNVFERRKKVNEIHCMLFTKK